MPTIISLQAAQEILNTLAHKEIRLSCGYGGVMFLEIGDLQEHHFEYEQGKPTSRIYGSYRLFCDENWNFSDGKELSIDRWTSSSGEVDELFTSLRTRSLEKVEIIGAFEKTVFYLSGGYTFTIIKDDALQTFSLVLIPEKKRLTVRGNREITFNDYEEDLSHLKKRTPRPARTESISVTRNFLREQSPDELPLSFEKAQAMVLPILHQPLQALEAHSGTSFDLSFGPDCRFMFSGEDQKIWVNPQYRWTLTVDEVSVLKRSGEVIVDVASERFHFAEKLTTALEDQEMISFQFGPAGAELQVTFTGGYTLSLHETQRYSRWYIHDTLTGFSFFSHRDEGLRYRVSAPLYLRKQFETGDVHLNGLLYELQFYRGCFAGSIP